MRLDTYKPKFHPRTLTFETQEEWDIFIDFISQSDVRSDHPSYDQLSNFGWTMYTMIQDGDTSSK